MAETLPSPANDPLACFSVHPEARDWNVGALCSYFSLDGWNSPRAANLALFLKVPNFNAPGAFYQDPLTQFKIWAQSANIPVSCLWIDTPHAYVLTLWNFHFSMVGPRFEVNFLAAKTFGSYFFLQFFPFLHTKWQQKMLVGFWKPFDCHSQHALLCTSGGKLKC